MHEYKASRTEAGERKGAGSSTGKLQTPYSVHGAHTICAAHCPAQLCACKCMFAGNSWLRSFSLACEATHICTSFVYDWPEFTSEVPARACLYWQLPGSDVTAIMPHACCTSESSRIRTSMDSHALRSKRLACTTAHDDLRGTSTGRSATHIHPGGAKRRAVRHHTPNDEALHR